MSLKTTIRKEYKGRWEGRTPLTPTGTKELLDAGLALGVERSDVRIFSDSDYEAVGAPLKDGLDDAQIVLGIKEPPLDIIGKNQVHLCFSHTIKGQDYNMGLLQRFLDQGATLIDYEPMRDDEGVRTIAFGRYAGIAGAVDTFHVAAQKLGKDNRAGILTGLKQTWAYKTLDALKEALGAQQEVADQPIRVLIVGSGNVGRGAAEVCKWLGLKKISPAGVLADTPGSWYSVVSSTATDLIDTKDGSDFDRSHFIKHGGDNYYSKFDQFLGKFDILLQTPYWEEIYPRLLPKDLMVERKDDLPAVIGDISCDINGSLECTMRDSSIDEIAYTYVPGEHRIVEGFTNDGPTVMAIDHLPCELSLDASQHFSRLLTGYLPEIAAMDLSQDFENCGLGRLLSDATIVYNGKLTPKYAYLQEFLDAWHAKMTKDNGDEL